MGAGWLACTCEPPALGMLALGAVGPTRSCHLHDHPRRPGGCKSFGSISTPGYRTARAREATILHSSHSQGTKLGHRGLQLCAVRVMLGGEHAWLGRRGVDHPIRASRRTPLTRSTTVRKGRRCGPLSRLAPVALVLSSLTSVRSTDLGCRPPCCAPPPVAGRAFSLWCGCVRVLLLVDSLSHSVLCGVFLVSTVA